ncbi:arginase family protein [candidate division KSB1 bacterium]|nr:arginase family protein [candidate division KSB1 bacterium]
MQNRFVLSPFFLEKPLPAAERLALRDWIINKPLPQEKGQIKRMAIVHRHLADIVANTVKSGYRPVSIAGDCCTVIGVLAGLQRAGVNPRLVWLDAHGDFNTWETTPSGFIGGMPLAMIVGRGDQTLMQAVELTPLPERDVIIANARDLDPGERELLQQSGVLHVAEVTSVPQLVSSERPIHIHLDTDVIDASEAPAVRYPVKGGPTLNELRKVVQRLANTGRVVGVSMTLWDFEQDADKRTERTSMALLKATIGDD